MYGTEINIFSSSSSRWQDSINDKCLGEHKSEFENQSMRNLLKNHLRESQDDYIKDNVNVINEKRPKRSCQPFSMKCHCFTMKNTK